MKKSVLGIIDCNNFFASCERVFNPKLRNKPVIVLSNNDGCVVARSNEAKKIGIPMGSPVYKCKDLINKYDVNVLSSNYSLYGDMSDRVMKVIKKFVAKVEIYSIDEAFIDLTEMEKYKVDDFCKNLRKEVLKRTGIPVSIGIGNTKTLAKVANIIVKKNEIADGVMNLTTLEDERLNKLFAKLDIKDVWGIGWGLQKFLYGLGVSNVLQLKQFDSNLIRQSKGVLPQKTILELNKTMCFKFKNDVKIRKNVISSRSFGKPVKSLEQLEEAISRYTSKAAEKLRNQNLCAGYISVYILTNRHRKDLPQHVNSSTEKLLEATNYTPILVKEAKKIIRSIYKPGFLYKKAGVVMSELSPEKNLQSSFFETRINKNAPALMKVTDLINQKWGDGGIQLASEGIKKEWKMRNEFRSKRFTTSWQELLQVRI